jgi:hypothetical protein
MFRLAAGACQGKAVTTPYRIAIPRESQAAGTRGNSRQIQHLHRQEILLAKALQIPNNAVWRPLNG